MSTLTLRTCLILIAWAAVLFIFPYAASAQNTINVPGDQTTIQGAINVANNGDTVLVAPGTYHENINFNGKAITVTSSGGAAQTIIDGGANGSVVTFSSGETSSAVLSGFTIRNGLTYYAAGGIQITNSSPTIVSNMITQNHATSGIGINLYGGSPLIKNNVISYNTQTGSGGGGGGIYVTGNMYGSTGSPVIIGNTIAFNSVANGGDGGGIAVTYYAGATIRNNIIQGNVAYNYGGGIAVEGAYPSVVVQNIIVNNTSRGQSGGGVSLVYESAANVFANNTIAGNTAVDGSSGIYTSYFPQAAVFSNNIVVAAASQNAVTCDTSDSTGSAVFSNNDAYSASGQSWGSGCDNTSHPGNFSADPQFVNSAAGDWHLQPTSPTIDAGDNSAPNLPQTDFDGNPRILDGNNDCVSTVDLGAYELVRAANVSFSTNTLTFPSQPLATSSSPKSVTLSNTGSTCFQFSGLGVAGDFSQTNTCSAVGLRAGTSCLFNVTFSPTALGTRLGALSVSGSDGIAGGNRSVSLSGTGVDFSVAATPTAATVKHAKSVQFNVTVAPSGGAVSSAVALSCSGLPTAATCGFSPGSVIPGSNGANSALTLSTSGNTPRGTFNVQIVGSSGVTQHSTTVQLTVN